MLGDPEGRAWIRPGVTDVATWFSSRE